MAQGQLNAGHLGGRFLERTFPQKVNPVPSCVTETDVALGQPRQAFPEANRRVRKSAAMISLALSMGAHGLLLSHPDDKAVAAEPVTSESTAATAPSTLDVAVLSPNSEATATDSVDTAVVEHTVQEGQTLWQLARLYGVDSASVANINSIPADAVLRVGQVLRIPISNQVAQQVIQSDVAVSNSPEYYGLVSITPKAASLQVPSVSVVEENSALKAQQDAAVNQLQQKRETLRQGLAQLKTVHQLASVTPVVPQSPSEAPENLVGEGTEAAALEASYRVTPGDTLGAIARTYGVSQEQIVAVNQLSDPNMIRVDQVLVIPQTGSIAAAVQKSPIASQAVASSAPSSIPTLPMGGPSTAVEGVALPKVIADSSDIASPNGLAPVAGSQPQGVVKLQTEAKSSIVTLPLPAQTSESLPVVALNDSDTTDSAEGATLATAPFVRQGAAPSADSTSTLRYHYVENLREEIVKLRERYRTATVHQQTAPQSTAKVAAASLNVAPLAGTTPETTDRVNPELPSTDSPRTQVRNLQKQEVEPKAEQANPGSSPANATPEPSNSQLVATAPIGSQNYEPLLPSSLGQMVSPDLPPLGSVDAYLPGANGRFNGYIWPTKGVLTSGYGWRWGRMHRGIDIAGPIGTPIVAAAAGVVVTAGWNSGGYGNLVEIQHADGSVTLYAHNDRILVRTGQQVEQGQQIAEMGSTGYSTGPHSHFEVHLPGQGAVNPMAYLPRSGA